MINTYTEKALLDAAAISDHDPRTFDKSYWINKVGQVSK